MTGGHTIEFVEAQIIVPSPLSEVAFLGPLLDAIEATPLTPSHWGASEGLRDAYVRADLESFVAATPREDLTPELRRTQPVRYTAHWYTGDHDASSFHLVATAPSADDCEAVFAAVEQISDVVPIELATVDIGFVDQDPATMMHASANAHHLDVFVRCGPETVYPRTIFGPRLVKLMGGMGALQQSAADVRPLPASGGVAFDIVSAPWTAAPAVLKQAQVDVERQLRLAGMLARAAGDIETLPAPRWQPPP